jgi:zinc transport system ATP-binding protein
MQTMIKLTGVSFSYSSEPLLREIDLTIEKGSFVGIAGDNGSGKTTLLRLIAGLNNPQKGSIDRIGDETIAYVRQTTAGEEGNFPASVEEIVALGAVDNGMVFLSKKTKKLISETIVQNHLLEIRKKLFSELSGGQKQKVKIAKALVKNPQTLILDEPTSGLDEKGRQDLLLLLRRLNEEGKTIIMVSHRMDDFQDSTRIYRLDAGRLSEEISHASI